MMSISTSVDKYFKLSLETMHLPIRLPKTAPTGINPTSSPTANPKGSDEML